MRAFERGRVVTAKVQADKPDGSGAAEPPAALVAHWVAAGVVAPGARWQALPGGNTNRVWRIVPARPGAPVLVCKLYRPGGETPLFANDAAAEASALRALSGTGLAPDFVADAATGAGGSLIYLHVAGRVWRPQDDAGAVARALARLHSQPLPPDLPPRPGDARAMRDQARAMLAEIGQAGAELAAQEPPEAPTSGAAPVFVHGDATAGNVLVTPAGVTLIDWQCPGRGDPAGDLSLFLSPAMQAVSGNPPLSAAKAEAFLDAYGRPDIVARFRALQPLFRWRMAAYCLWRAARGDAGYARAAELEGQALGAALRG